jgi:hypothetical protein
MTNGTPDIFNVDGYASNVSQFVLKLKANINENKVERW